MNPTPSPAPEAPELLPIDATEEKARRIYYQNIVYDLCLMADLRLGKRPGNGIVFGSKDSPTTQLQDAFREILKPKDLDFVALHAKAQAHVQDSPLWKKFIDGTPLANDIAVWMAEFAVEESQ